MSVWQMAAMREGLSLAESIHQAQQRVGLLLRVQLLQTLL